MDGRLRADLLMNLRTSITALLGALLLASPGVMAALDIVVADFEADTYGSWRVTGEAFGPGPARGTLPGQMSVAGFQGRGLVNSFHRGDGSTGTLTSPPFTLERAFISFLIGGGKDLEKTCLKLVVDGQAVRVATGPNDKPGGSEALISESWDVREFAGRSAVLEIIDHATGGWGHINVDHIVQTDRRPPGLITNASRVFQVRQRYLNLPIRNGAPKRQVTLLVGERVVVRNDIELANGTPDWWAPMDVGSFQGRTIRLEVDRLPEDSKALSAIVASDAIEGGEELYRERLRGQFHFSSRRGWNNDPNGLVFFNGEYHLFYQHNPYGWGWGNMHWGHAVSGDLVHWREVGDTLLPDDMGPMFSGSAVVDWNNTSGLGRDGKPPLVLIYTAAGNPTVQGIASSTDGRTFTKYPGNPVLKQITAGNRDPKVMWHEPTQKWVMVLYVGLQGGRHTVHFFTSPNLREWTLASVTEGIPGSPYLYECPDFFELAVDGDERTKKWVLLAANGEYATGTFDGTRFQPEQSRLPGHRGRGFYAAQSFSGIPASDGRRILIGWFQTETKGMPFNQSMTLPLELRLLTTAQGPRMTFQPVRELESLRARSHGWPAMTLTPASPNPLADTRAELVELRAECEPGEGVDVIFTVRGARVVYEAATQELVVQGHRAPAPLRDGKLRLTLFCDRTGLEVFASDGLTYVPMPFQPEPEDRVLGVAVKGGTARFTTLHVHELQSAWEEEVGAVNAAVGMPKQSAAATPRPVEGGVAPFLGEPRFEMQSLFATDRFPTVVVATDGSVLAFWNGVKVRRSEDGGRSWGGEIAVGKGFMGGGVTVDEASGDILAFVEASHPPSAISIYRSSDHGKTWEPQDVVISPDRRGNAPSMHMNEHGVTLRHGRHKGRLIRPTRSYAGGNDKTRWPEHYTNAIYSDDGGRTWRTSDPFPAFGTGEATLAELADGRIYYNSRRHWAPPREDPRRRWTAWSEDGGETWTGLSICRVLPDGDQDRDYGLMGGLVRLPIQGRDILIYSNIESPSGRHHGHVWASFDGGKTWPVKRLIFDGAFAYSSLDAGRPGTPGEGWIYLLFEGGPNGGGAVARFNLSWLTRGEKTGDGVIPSR